ncbi:TPA: LTA synthase family protein [Acinetobacter nosocomialis]|uniref:LTA synthase family protein n=1 Tax=Acinetobacter calcoaceticus/baumannii complex TaxID=909768 RepID=UPI0004500C72|nr:MULTISPECIES: LTA synthase family protein [Acinetobacter calcoaceticus/baumannii complex]KCZ30561.1 sulfatase family protein [Acinetobacter baumannii 25977_9]EXB11053.1 sulfatase family protein [Acinetobacter sp. 1396970]EXH75903.1 sulfatase family protein [Acinetobacter sp. 216872]EXS44186.1 sulfatase family protein [Acinetobacter sp. 88816]EXT40629.1 sulfatase family protein [Acinetobacter sp. 25977_8]
MVFLRQQLLFIFIAFLSTCLGVYVAWDMNLSLSKFYTYFSLHRACFSLLFNYTVIQLFFILLGRKYAALILSQLVVIFLNFINQKKQQYLFSNLSPEDIFLVPEAMKASPWLLQLVFFALIVVFMVVLLVAVRKESKATFHTYVPNIIIFSLLCCSLVYINFIKNPNGACTSESKPTFCIYLNSFPNTRNNWVGDYRNIQDYGFTTFYVSKLLDNVTSILLPSRKVSEQTIQQLMKQYNKPEEVVQPNKSQRYPNIVVVMEESYWDARLLDTQLPQDMAPFFDKNQVTHLLSPSFGGGTANVEFEVLTSLNTTFFPNELLYVSKLKKTVYALPFYLNTLGYQTVAMHNNYGDYYNRNTVYPNLGFQKFISLENMVAKRDQGQLFNAGGWASDDVIFKSLQDTLKQNPDQPKFIYAITVENHPMYNDERYGKQDFKFSQTLSETDRRKLSTYTAGTIRANQKLLELKQFLKTLNQPTILLVFGDHLPNLQGVYDTYNFFKDDPERNNLKNYQTPFAVWSNYKLSKKVFKQPYVAASFVAPKLLQMSGIPLSNYYQFIQQVSQCYNAVHQKFLLSGENCDVDQKALLEQYKNLNYDVLDGNNHTYQLLKN